MFVFEFRLKQGPGKASLVQGSDKVIPKPYLKHFRPYRVRLAVEHDRFFTMFKRGPNKVQTRSREWLGQGWPILCDMLIDELLL